MTKAILLSSSFVTTAPPDYGLPKEIPRIKKYAHIQSKHGYKGIFTCKYSNRGNCNCLKDSGCSESEPLLNGKNEMLRSRPSFLQHTEQPSMLLTL